MGARSTVRDDDTIDRDDHSFGADIQSFQKFPKANAIGCLVDRLESRAVVGEADILAVRSDDDLAHVRPAHARLSEAGGARPNGGRIGPGLRRKKSHKPQENGAKPR